MTTYQEITEKVIAFSNARADYWHELQGVALDFAKEFEDSLDLEWETWDDNNGVEHKYVEIGIIENGKFDIKHPGQLAGKNDLSLPFVMRIALEEGPNVLPKFYYRVEASIKSGGEFYIFNIDSGENKFEFKVKKHNTPEKFSDVIAAIKKEIIQAFDAGIFR
ncbi:hypothetical protein [Microvirgula aerodenitrificans]|uniref:hypothetical protein n=1 Tax=Microvirgula aerodenitrificans TaxID=57480 RepID=UPI0028EC7D08|nr:hypothetical protein [Microvirgula aerodenitrificans]